MEKRRERTDGDDGHDHAHAPPPSSTVCKSHTPMVLVYSTGIAMLCVVAFVLADLDTCS